MIPERHITTPSNVFSSYWENPNSYLNRIKSPNINLLDANQMVPYYFEVDELGDAIAKEYLIDMGFKTGMGKLNQIIKNYPNNIDKYSEAMQRFLNQVFHIPSWLDTELLMHGSNFCNRSGTFGLATLRNYSLMGGYESAAINKPLIFTESLKKGAVKRLADTVSFWVNVTGKNNMNHDKTGFYNTIFTRLIHSYSRIMILKNPNWNSAKWGKPLNIWDMLATNLGFSIAFIDGLKKLSFKPSEVEIKGTLHLWKYVGYLLGIPEHLLVDTEQQAADAFYLWSKTQKPADKDSIALAKALYLEPKHVNFTNSKLLKAFVYNTNLGYNYLLLGNYSCKQLNIPYSKAFYWVKTIRFFNHLSEKSIQKSEKKYLAAVKKGYNEQIKVCDLYTK